MICFSGWICLSGGSASQVALPLSLLLCKIVAVKRFSLCSATLLFTTHLAVASPHPHHVITHKNSGAWELLVDGKPFYVKGVGCNLAKGEKGEDFLHMAHDMGANTVRTWGGAPRSYLDKAHSEKLMVDLGIWIDPIRDAGSKQSYLNPRFVGEVERQILFYVREMKDHPALLSWNIGNEALSFTDDPAEKQALGEFLESIVRLVHGEDPNHPVLYSCSADRDLADLKKLVPSINIVGTNVYGSLSPVLGWMRNNDYDKPLLVTEFGPLGAWDCPKDKNSVPYDPFDHIKTNDYLSIWRQIEAAKGKVIGGFAFVLGEPRNQDSLSWYNLNLGDLKRDAFIALSAIYHGKKIGNHAPKILGVTLSQNAQLTPGQRIEIDVQARDADGDRVTYDYFVTNIALDPLIVEPPQFFPAETEVLGPGKARIRVPNDPGNYRVYALVKDTHKNAAVTNRSIQVGEPPH